MQDKIMVEIKKTNVFLNDFQAFPKVLLDNQTGSFMYVHYAKHHKARDVNNSRMDYFV